MTKHDLELVMLGIALADPSRRDAISVLPAGILHRLNNADKLMHLLGVGVEPGQTVANLIAEWNRRVEAEIELAKCKAELFEVKAKLWKL